MSTNYGKNYKPKHSTQYENIQVFLCFLGFLLILISNLVIGSHPCFRNNHPTIYYHYVLITCVLAIGWFSNIVLYCLLYDVQFNEDFGKMFFQKSDHYKNINIGFKLGFAIGFIILHGVSFYLYLSDNKNYSLNAQCYIKSIFWISQCVDTFNLFILFCDNWADMFLDFLTILVIINNLIIGSILSQTTDYLTYKIILSFGFSNIFVGLYIGVFITKIFKYTSICVV